MSATALFRNCSRKLAMRYPLAPYRLNLSQAPLN